jgi:hypothetical protein
MQTLNIMDEVMASLHDHLRRRGGVGLPVHSYVLLKGRIDEAGLRGTLARLGQHRPVVGARLVPAHGAGRRQWAGPPGPACPLTVAEVNGPGNSGVWRYAERLFDTIMEPRVTAPVQFHLLRLPDGRDAVVLQWAHGLMDGKAGELLLREVNRLHAGGPDDEAAEPAGDPVGQHLGRHSVWQQVKGFLALVRTGAPRGITMRLAAHGEVVRPPRPVRVLVRALDGGQSARYQERVRRLCGFFNPAPVLVAAGFRAVRRLDRRRLTRHHACYTHVPVNLRAPGATRPVFGNLQTYIALNAFLPQLDDFTRLARGLQRQLRQQIRDRVDLGYLAGIRFLSSRHRLTGDLLARVCQYLSFVFGYHGTVGPGLETFCGAEVEELFSGLPLAWSPPGLTFAAHQYHGRLQLMTSFLPGAVPEAVAGAFLDAVTDDLLGE